MACMLASYGAMLYHYKSFRFDNKDSDFVYMIESKILDLRMKLRGPLHSSSKIGILAVDEKAIAQFGRWPFSRRYYAQAFQNLKNLGVRWIGFDAIFAEVEGATGPDFSQVIEELRTSRSPASFEVAKLDKILQESPADSSFTQAIATFANIVMGYLYFEHDSEITLKPVAENSVFPQLGPMKEASEIMIDMPSGRTLASYRELARAKGILANIPPLTGAAHHFGFFSNNADNDAINRWITLVADVGGSLMPSLSLKLAAESLDREIAVVFDEFGINSLVLVKRDNPEDVIEIPTDARGSGRMLINHLGPSHSIPHFSLADAYNNSFSKREKKFLKDAILIFGGTASGTNDIRANPFDSSLDGVENHAAALDNILSQRYLLRSTSIYRTELLIILGIGLLFAPLMIYGQALISGIAVLAFLLGYLCVDKFFWFGQGTWAYLAIPSLEIFSMFGLTTLYKYFTEERERKKVKGTFQHYLSPAVIKQLLDNPKAMQLGGVKRELTVLFSDMRGFTSISESLTPEALCSMMNQYFTPMTSIILRSGGVLDKYIGDAIMAFWGAPIELPQHADIAAKAALDMMRAMDRLKLEFKERGLPPIDIGIGLNTGFMSVGNMGSNERFTYTVMGDAVNLGSRLESLTKEYGVSILISEFTQKQLTPGHFFLRDIDDVRVKGKREPVHIFEVMLPHTFRSEAELRAFIDRFAAGRQAYKRQDWVAAIALFGQCLELRSDDVASRLYIERCQEAELQAMPASWDGVYTFVRK